MSKKEATVNADTFSTGGYVFVSEGANVGHQAIAFKIAGNSSTCVSVGMGLADVVKAKQYVMNDSDTNHGTYMISSMGVSFQHKDPEKQQTQQSFVFSQDDIIEVEWNDKTKKLQFSRRNGLQKFTIDVNLTQAQMQKMQFMIGLFDPDDKVAIVE